MLTPVSAIPLQIVIQLIAPGNVGSGNTTLALGPSSSNQTPELPEGYTAFPDVGMAYKYYNTSGTTWNMARKRCIADGASLGVLDSTQKRQYVQQLKGADRYGMWVGIHRYFDDDEWVSVKTGLPVEAIPWQAGPPGEDEKNKKCLATYANVNSVSADPCDDPYSYVCEIEIPRVEKPTGVLSVN